MKSYSKIAGILLLSIFVTIFVSPVIAGILPFHLYKVMSRVALISTFLLFLYYRERLGFQNIRALGFNLTKKWWLFLISGFILGVLSIGIISTIMLHASIRFVIPGVLSINWLKYLTGYILAGFIVGLIEESFFRGFILQLLLKDTKVIPSLLITNIFYSAVHFLKPNISGNVEVLNLFSSVHAVPLFFTPLFAELAKIWPSIFGLFLVGVVLSLAYIKVKQLSLPIGMHAGWIVGIKSLSLGTDVTTGGSLWLKGDVVSHPIGWIVLSMFIIVLYAKRSAKKI